MYACMHACMHVCIYICIYRLPGPARPEPVRVRSRSVVAGPDPSLPSLDPLARHGAPKGRGEGHVLKGRREGRVPRGGRGGLRVPVQHTAGACSAGKTRSARAGCSFAGLGRPRLSSRPRARTARCPSRRTCSGAISSAYPSQSAWSSNGAMSESSRRAGA